METIELYCGNSQIILGGDEVVAGCKVVELDFNIIEKLLVSTNFDKYQILGDASELLEEIKKSCKYVESAGGYVLNNVGQSLVIFRNGLWDLPKGKVEQDETVENAAVREVEEETGIVGTKIERKLADTYHFYRWKDEKTLYLKKTYWFLMSCKGGRTMPQVEEGITSALWVDDGMLDEMLNKTHRNLKLLFNFKKDGRI